MFLESSSEQYLLKIIVPEVILYSESEQKN